MPKARKKSIEIEFVRYDGLNINDVAKLGGTRNVRFADNMRDIQIETLEGTMTANEGDYIIKGVKGEIYPCKPEIFNETYDVTSWL